MGGAITIGNDGSKIFWHGDGIEHCDECCLIAEYLCDWPMGRGKTCDHKLCQMHSHPIAADHHLCPIHAAVFKSTGVMEPIKVKRLEVRTETE